jgi:tetratricopeptide (TPR) repeat protein
MKILIRLFLATLTTVIFCVLCMAEGGVVVIHVSDADENPLSGVLLGNKGDGTTSSLTNSTGTTRLELPKAMQPGDWVHLQIVKGKESNENWILISPWDGRIQVPLSDNKSDRFVTVVVAQKFDKRLLSNPKALRAMAESVLNELAPKTAGETLTSAQQHDILVTVAQKYGLEPNEIDKAIRAWGQKAKDPYELGLVALLEKNYPAATPLLTKSLEIRKSKLEEVQAEVLDAAVRLGQSLFQEGKYQDAANTYREAINLRPDDTTILSSLALSLTMNGSYAEAEPIHKKALEIRQKTLGSNHADIANTLNNLAVLYYNQGKYREAEPLYKQALEIGEKVLGPNHHDVGQSLNNLAGLYSAQGKYDEAEPLFKRALEIRQKALGINHSDVAQSLNNLAGLYGNQGKYAEAEPLFKQALTIWEKNLGPNHPDVGYSLNNLAELYQHQGKYLEAEPLYKRALLIFEKALGGVHPDVAYCLNTLAGMYVSQGKYAEAEPLYKRAMEIFEKALRYDHPDVATCVNGLAKLYREQGKYREAETLFKRALTSFEKELGPDHPNVANVLEDYSTMLKKTNQGEAAAKMETRAKAIRAKYVQKNPKN